MGGAPLPDPPRPAAVHCRGRQVTPNLTSCTFTFGLLCLEELTPISVFSSRLEMEKWVEDIQMAVDLAEKSSGPTPEFLASSPPDNSEWWGEQILHSQ